MYIAPTSRCSCEHPNNCQKSFDSYRAKLLIQSYKSDQNKKTPTLYLTKTRLFSVLWRKDFTRR